MAAYGFDTVQVRSPVYGLRVGLLVAFSVIILAVNSAAIII